MRGVSAFGPRRGTVNQGRLPTHCGLCRPSQTPRAYARWSASVTFQHQLGADEPLSLSQSGATTLKPRVAVSGTTEIGLEVFPDHF